MKVIPGKGIHKHHNTEKDYTKEKPLWWKEPELHKKPKGIYRHKMSKELCVHQEWSQLSLGVPGCNCVDSVANDQAGGGAVEDAELAACSAEEGDEGRHVDGGRGGEGGIRPNQTCREVKCILRY